MLRTVSTIIILGFMVTFFVCSNSHAAGEPSDQARMVAGVLAGQFRINSKTPLANGRLFIYNKSMGSPSADSYVRVPDQIAGLDNNGKFSLELPAGTYYLSAVNVPENAPMGPPADGEKIYFKKDSAGKIQGYNVSAGKKTNAGIVSTSFPYKRNPDQKGRGVTSISGVVSDASGAPAEGAVILVYLNRDILDKAFYISEKTAKDGKFIVYVNDGGSFFLRVRGDYGGGIPKEGEFVNINDPKELVEVQLKKGEALAGVALQVKHQQERGPLYKGK